MPRRKKADTTEQGVLPFEGETGIAQFKDKGIRRVFHDGQWYFSVTDVVEAVAESARPAKYWSDLKRKLANEGFDQLSEKIGQLPMTAADGRVRQTDVADTETMFRIIQSITSPKAEPFKRWLAKTGFERLQEFQNPEIAIKRAMLDYELQGRSNEWIRARVRTIISRKELTGEWSKRGVEEGVQYATLTNVISKETFEIDTQQHKEYKGLARSHNLRDHMTDLELVFTMLGETSTVEFARMNDAQGFVENKTAAHLGGRIAGDARKNLENQLGRGVVSRENFLPGQQTQEQLIDGGKQQ